VRPRWLISATTTTASVLAARLIVKLTAIGQRSMRHRSVVASFDNVFKLDKSECTAAGHDREG
jgi:hypothetical protein